MALINFLLHLPCCGSGYTSCYCEPAGSFLVACKLFCVCACVCACTPVCGNESNPNPGWKPFSLCSSSRKATSSPHQLIASELVH